VLDFSCVYEIIRTMYKIIKNLLFFYFFQVITAAVPLFKKQCSVNCSSSDLTTGQVRIPSYDSMMDFVWIVGLLSAIILIIGICFR